AVDFGVGGVGAVKGIMCNVQANERRKKAQRHSDDQLDKWVKWIHEHQCIGKTYHGQDEKRFEHHVAVGVLGYFIRFEIRVYSFFQHLVKLAFTILEKG